MSAKQQGQTKKGQAKKGQHRGNGPKAGAAKPAASKTTSRRPAASNQKPWAIGPLVRAFLIGFLVCAASVRYAPGKPFLTFLLGGAAVGLASLGPIQALSAAVAAELATVGTLAITWQQLQAFQVTGQTVAVGLVAVVTGSLGFWLAGTWVDRRWLAWALLCVIIVFFMIQAVGVVHTISPKYASELPNEGYAFDPLFFAKVFYMQDRGVPFYQAYGEAFAADARFDKPTPDLAGWRSPTTSTIWTVLFSNAVQILWAFVFLSVGAMVATYYIARKISDDVSALVAPALLAPYYLAAISLLWFTEYEFWAGFVVIASAVLIIMKRYWWALPVAFLAGAMREWLIGGVIAPAIDLLAKRKWKMAIPWIVATFAVAAVYVANMYFVRRYLVSVGVTPSLGASGRLGGGGPGFILYTVKFCSVLLAHPIIVPWAAFALALVGAARRVYLKDYYLPALLILPLLAFIVFGSGQSPLGPTGWNDYYNAAYWPFAVLLIPAAWGFLVPEEQKQVAD